MLVLIMFYAFVWMLTPKNLSNKAVLTLHFVHALTWCIVHFFGLGLLLHAQSRSKFLVRHYVKNYHYPDGGKGAVVEAFTNWKAIYNMSMCMTYGNSLTEIRDDDLDLIPAAIYSVLRWCRCQNVLDPE